MFKLIKKLINLCFSVLGFVLKTLFRLALLVVLAVTGGVLFIFFKKKKSGGNGTGDDLDIASAATEFFDDLKPYLEKVKPLLDKCKETLGL